MPKVLFKNRLSGASDSPVSVAIPKGTVSHTGRVLSVNVNDGSTPWMTDWGGTAKFALEITSPHPSHASYYREFWAHSTITYEIGVAAVGGVFPYLYEVSNAPAGMTCDPQTGWVQWTTPTTTATGVVFRVTDTEGTTTTRTITITVDDSKFHVVDAVNGTAHPTGAGTPANPWRTLEDVVEHSSPDKLTYFRTGTYNFAGIDPGTEFNEGYAIDVVRTARSTIWLTYPGESPVLDYRVSTLGSIGGPAIYWNGYAHVDGFQVKDGYHKFFQEGHTYRRCEFFTMVETNVSNHAAIMVGHSDPSGTYPAESFPVGHAHYGLVFQDVIVRDMDVDSNGILLYDNGKSLVERCEANNIGELVHHKNSCSQFTFRGNFIHGTSTYVGFGGNFNDQPANQVVTPTYGECCFNRFLGFDVDPNSPPYGAISLGYSWGGAVPSFYSYRNTYNGNLLMGNRVGDGTMVFERDVIVNQWTSDPGSGHTHFTDDPATGNGPTWNQVTEADMLKGVAGDSIINLTTGALQGSYLTNHGPNSATPKGHMVPS